MVRAKEAQRALAIALNKNPLADVRHAHHALGPKHWSGKGHRPAFDIRLGQLVNQLLMRAEYKKKKIKK